MAIQTDAHRDCPFCISGGDQSTRNYSILFGGGSSDLLYVGSSAYIAIDVAPVAPGHLLIIANEHRRSLYGWWRKDAPERKLWKGIRDAYRERLDQKVAFFEHGMPDGNPEKLSCIDHAHIHAIPVCNNLRSLFDSEFHVVREANPQDGFAWDRHSEQYFCFLDTDGDLYYTKGSVLPSQTIRRLTSLANGKKFWNWRDYVDFGASLKTRSLVEEGRRFYEAVDSYFES